MSKQEERNVGEDKYRTYVKRHHSVPYVYAEIHVKDDAKDDKSDQKDDRDEEEEE